MAATSPSQVSPPLPSPLLPSPCHSSHFLLSSPLPFISLPSLYAVSPACCVLIKCYDQSVPVLSPSLPPLNCPPFSVPHPHFQAFYVSFIITPLCSNASEIISSLMFASKMKKINTSMTFSQVCEGMHCHVQYVCIVELYTLDSV